MQPRTIEAFAHADRVELAAQCQRWECRAYFVAYYSSPTKTEQETATGETKLYLRLRRCLPLTPSSPTVHELVKAVSPTFVEVYEQALASEAHNLGQLTGIGLRKALEFLVKDFAKDQAEKKVKRDNPTVTDAGDLAKLVAPEHEKIEKKRLGECIRDHIDDERTKEVARRAAYIGNDETHYIRKFTALDIRDLKNLMTLTINAVTNVLLTEQMMAAIP